MCVSGLHWNIRVPGRAQKTEDALQFVARQWNLAKAAGIKKIGFENPVGCIPTRIVKDTNGHLIVCSDRVAGFKPTQIIQPWHYGDDASKKTCLWLDGLPSLTRDSEKAVKPRLVEVGSKVYYRWGNQTDSGQNKLGPSDDRAEQRSKTYPGIAEAMAEQWAPFL
jgi:hypothetical protein